MWSQRINASSECSLFRDIHNTLTVSNIWKVSIEKPGSLELMTFLAKLVCQKIYLTKQTCTICNDVFKDFLKHVLFDCNINRAYVHRVKLYYMHFVNIEMQVGVRTLNLLKYSTDLQQSKYMLGYVDNNLIDVLPTDIYPQFMCLNAEFFAQVCSQYAM